MANIPSFFTREEIASSIGRVISTFRGNYGLTPIFEGKTPIGRIEIIADKAHQIAVTFRGSLGWEAVSCAWMWKTSLKEIGFSGWVHYGANAAFLTLRNNLTETVEKLLKAFSQPQKVIFVVEGHSRGAIIASLVAAYLKYRYQDNPLYLINFSEMAILGKEASEKFNRVIPKENHLSFAAIGDFFVPLSNWFSFYHGGTLLKFDPKRSSFYNEHVAKKEYPHLVKNWLMIQLVKLVLSPAQWNAHMPETYQDAAPLLV